MFSKGAENEETHQTQASLILSLNGSVNHTFLKITSSVARDT
jgi:hypothetical protein